MSLKEKAMLVRLGISQWTGRKYDRSVSEKVAADYGTTTDAGRYNKVLIANEAIKTVQQVANEARIYHYQNTLPWNDNGDRILPAMNFDHYSEKMREQRAKYEQTVREFISAYPDLVREAQARLNGMFNETDYPSPDEIKLKFNFAVDINPVPAEEDFRLELGNEETERIKAQIEERARRAQEIAMRDLWDRLYEAVKRMAGKLNEPDRENGKPPIFRDSLIKNIIDLVDLLPRLNLTNDPHLEEMRREVEARLCNYTPKELRETSMTRKTAAQDAEEILKAMSGYMGGEQHGS